MYELLDAEACGNGHPFHADPCLMGLAWARWGCDTCGGHKDDPRDGLCHACFGDEVAK